MAKGAGAQGTLAPGGDGVIIAAVAQANRLHNKALAGSPQPGNSLRLSLVEAAHCVASGWLEVTGPRGPLAAPDLLALSPDRRRAMTDYLVYRDLRARGLVARHAPGTSHFDVWPRGTGEGKPLFQNVACSARDPAGTADLLQGAPGGIVCSVVDDDSVVTHYKLHLETPAGTVAAKAVPSADGLVLADRVLVTDAKACASYAAQFLGTEESGGRLLSLLEAAVLQSQGLLRTATPLPSVPKQAIATALALREAGVVAKSGLRFGADLRGYVGAPDDAHAEWLIDCAAPDEALPWSDLARGVRLAHGVRKKFLVAIPDGAAIRFVHLSWLRV